MTLFTWCYNISFPLNRTSVPPLFLKLARPNLFTLETAFQPCLSIITWVSLEVPEVCEGISNAIREVQIFMKEVKDIKEARVDQVLKSIADAVLVNLSDYPLSPIEFSSENQTFGQLVAIDIEMKSAAAEKAVISIINKFLDVIIESEDADVKYTWMDSEKITKLIPSKVELSMGLYEPGWLIQCIVTLIFRGGST